MKIMWSRFIAAVKRKPCVLGANVVGLCVALTGLIGCQGPAPVADARKSESGPIRKHPDNPHYFSYKGKPLVLIASDQHYGAVINLDFDYLPFLDRLHEYGLNLTRIYPGAYVEMKDQYAKGNPLGPAPDRYILPWNKSTVSGANTNLGIYKYDLDTWDEAYFKRLKDYVHQAALRDIIVEIALFNGMYDDRWAAQPLYHANNVQGVGTCEFKHYTTLADKPLVETQLRYVKKIASELIEFDNVIYDISDEPEMQGQNSWPWNSAMLDALISVDHHKHMYGETAHSASPDFTKDRRISWLPTEYISPMEMTLDKNYMDGKPIIDVETAYYPSWYGHPVEETRAEGWYGMLGGLAGIIHLNAEFSTSNPAAKGTSTEKEVLPQKRVLMDFMRSLNFVKMTKFTGFRLTDPGALARGIAQPGKQYALYVFHGTRKWENWSQGPTASRFNVDVNWFADTVSIDLPRGTYSTQWINPATGAVIAAGRRESSGGQTVLETPRYYTDIALKIDRPPVAGGRSDLNSWDQAAAARYLDERMDLWFENARQLPTGEGQAACISCHSVVPYLLARPALRKAMHITEPTSQEVRLLDNITRRVETSWNRASMSDPKHGGERGTEEVLNALILARHDADEGKSQASEITRKAFRQLWETQRPDGAWDWMDFAQEPDESADARFYGATLAAVAVGTAPALWGGSGGYSTANEGSLRSYLRKNYARQNLYNRAWMLLASTCWPGLMTQPEFEELIAELKPKQNRDGGWSLWELGPWRWSKGAPPFAPPGKPDLALLQSSDGYATGLIVYALRQAGLSASDPSLTRATAWLKANQKEVRVERHAWKCWRAYSLNHDRENGGATGGAWRQMLMSDTATAFAVLALSTKD